MNESKFVDGSSSPLHSAGKKEERSLRFEGSFKHSDVRSSREVDVIATSDLKLVNGSSFALKVAAPYKEYRHAGATNVAKLAYAKESKEDPTYSPSPIPLCDQHMMRAENKENVHQRMDAMKKARHTTEAFDIEAERRTAYRDRKAAQNSSLEKHQRFIQRNLLAMKSNLENFSYPKEEDITRQHDIESTVRETKSTSDSVLLPAQHQLETSCQQVDRGDGGGVTFSTNSSPESFIYIQCASTGKFYKCSTQALKLGSHRTKKSTHSKPGIPEPNNIDWLEQHLSNCSSFTYGILAGLSVQALFESFIPRTMEEFTVEVSRLAQESRRLFYITTSLGFGVSLIFLGSTHREWSSIPWTKGIQFCKLGFLAFCYLLGLILSLTCEAVGRNRFMHQETQMGGNNSSITYHIVSVAESEVRAWKTLNIVRSTICIFGWCCFCFSNVYQNDKARSEKQS